MDVINYNFSDLEKYHHNFSYCKLAITQDLLVGNVFTYLLKMPPVHSDKVPRLSPSRLTSPIRHSFPLLEI
jgi:hypothetical protein